MSLDITLMTKEETCLCCGSGGIETVFNANITHNLNTMAIAGGFYKALWGHDENIKSAKDLIEPLERGLKEMKEKPNHFKQFNSKNGWGLYKNFVPWLEKLINACKEYPKANIYISK